MATFFASIAPELPAEGAAGPVGWVVMGVSLAIAALATLFSGIFGGTDWNAVNAALTKMRAVLTEVADSTARFAWTVAVALGKLLQMIEQAFIGFFEYMWELIKRLWKYIEKIVSAVLPQLAQAIHKALDWLKKIYHDYLRPILNWIQIARRYLLILRLMGLKIATKLDAILGKIQGRIFGPFLYALRMFNQFSGWYNVMLAWDLTVQRPIFIRTMTKYQGDWINMFWQAQGANLPAGGGITAPPPGGPPPNTQEISDFQQYAATGTGPYATIAVEAQQILSNINAAV